MRLRIYAVGRIRNLEWQALIADYSSRISHYVRCEVVEFKDDGTLLRHPPEGDVIVALEVSGSRLSSTRFAQKLESWSRCGQGMVAFVIGGTDGIPPDIARLSTFRLSISDMTLPHRLARVVLLEQIYRAQTILRGEPYARES